MLSPKMIGEAIDKVIELEKAEYCPFCGYKKQRMDTKDINSLLTCSAPWCSGFDF